MARPPHRTVRAAFPHTACMRLSTEFKYDTDPKQSAQSRVKMLSMLADKKIPLLAYHFAWPGHRPRGQAGRRLPLPSGRDEDGAVNPPLASERAVRLALRLNGGRCTTSDAMRLAYSGDTVGRKRSIEMSAARSRALVGLFEK
jgi:hypothetical protein